MGLSDFFSSFIPTVYADEEPQVEEVVEEVVEETPVEEEEEEEEPEDPKEAIWEGNLLYMLSWKRIQKIKHFKSINQSINQSNLVCTEECSALKHHLDECNERVENGSSENCKYTFCIQKCLFPELCLQVSKNSSTLCTVLMNV